MKKPIYSFIISLFLLFSCNKNDNKKTIVDEDVTCLFNKVKDLKCKRNERIDLLDKIYSSFENKKYNQALKNDYFRLADLYFKNNIKENQLKTYKKILQRAEYSKDPDGIIKSNCSIGGYYFVEFVNDSAFYYFSKAEKISKKTKGMPYMTTILQNKANLFWCQKDFAGAEATATKALKSAISKGYKDMMFYSYITIANSLVGINNNKKALQYYEQANKQIDYLESNNQKLICKASTHNYIALVYQKKRLYQKTIDYLNSNVNLNEIKKTDLRTYSFVINTIAYSKFKLNDKSSLSLFKEVEQIADSIKLVPTQVEIKTYLGEYYLAQRDTLKANYYLKQAQIQAHKNAIFEDELKILKLLEQANPSQELFYSNRYIELNDSLQNIERATRDKFARIEFETDEITNQKDVVSKENNLLYKRIWVISGFAVLSLLIILLWIKNQSQLAKTRELLLKQEQKKSEEEIFQLMIDQQNKIEEGKNTEKQRISLDLHDNVMGKLTAVRLNLFYELSKEGLENKESFDNLSKQIQAVEIEIRDIAHNLNTNLFSNNASFVEIVKELFAKIENHSAITFTLDVGKTVNWDAINNDIKINLYRIIQEALQNIEKYANANSVVISIMQNENQLSLEIADDGKGFTTSSSKEGIGIKNMKTRAKAINATITIDSKINSGTKINLMVII